MFAAGELATVVPNAPPALAAHLGDPHLWHFDWGGVLACCLPKAGLVGHDEVSLSACSRSAA